MTSVTVKKVCGLCDHIDHTGFCSVQGYIVEKDKEYNCKEFVLKKYLVYVSLR